MSYFKDFVHNAVVHPLMMIMPAKTATKFHDWNARWAFSGNTRYDEIKAESEISKHNRRAEQVKRSNP